MAIKTSILSLLALVAVVASNPFGFGIEVGGKSHLGAGGSAGGKAGVGYDEGLTAGARGKAEVHGGWIKSLFGKVYVANEDGKGIGLGGSVGSDMGAVVNGSAGVGGATNIVSSSGAGKAGLDADGHYRAGANIHVLNQDEVGEAVYNARTFTNRQDEKYYQTEEDLNEQANKPKYSKWID